MASAGTQLRSGSNCLNFWTAQQHDFPSVPVNISACCICFSLATCTLEYQNHSDNCYTYQRQQSMMTTSVKELMQMLVEERATASDLLTAYS